MLQRQTRLEMKHAINQVNTLIIQLNQHCRHTVSVIVASQTGMSVPGRLVKGERLWWWWWVNISGTLTQLSKSENSQVVPRQSRSLCECECGSSDGKWRLQFRSGTVMWRLLLLLLITIGRWETAAVRIAKISACAQKSVWLWERGRVIRPNDTDAENGDFSCGKNRTRIQWSRSQCGQSGGRFDCIATSTTTGGQGQLAMAIVVSTGNECNEQTNKWTTDRGNE